MHLTRKENIMKTTKNVLVVALLFAGFGCGYGSHSTTPPSPGTTPNISQLAPDSATAGMTGVVLTVNGTNFNSNATIDWNGTALSNSTFISANQMMVTLPNSDIAVSGTATVTVTNPGTPGGIYGGGTSPETSNSMSFTINQ
jgi:hypothetical protein